jgi:Zn-dependent protease with chaperone function
MDAVPTTALAVTYLDGHSARPHAVQMHRAPDGLYLVGEGVEAHIPLDEVVWPERTRHGVRIAHFRQGGEVQCSDLAAWERWVAVHGPRESVVVRMQQSWRSVLVSAVVLLGLLLAAYGWGLPVLGNVLVAATPVSVDQTLGESSLEALDDSLMRPSKLSAEQQQRVLQGWQQAVAALPADQAPPWRLVFRDSRIGPNAFALPGDTMVMTDQLVELVDGDVAVLSAVLAHELGHLKHRHGMQMLVKTGLLGAVTSVVFGDFSGLLSAAPLLLGHAHYSRDAERQADAFSVQVLQAAGMSPLAMVTLFEKLDQHRRTRGDGADPNSLLGIAFASHPSDAERIAFFKEAAAKGPRAAGSASN